MFFSKEASSTGLHSPKKLMQSIYLSESSASTSPMMMYSSGVTTYPWENFATMIRLTIVDLLELETHNLKFKYIQGVKNTLACFVTHWRPKQLKKLYRPIWGMYTVNSGWSEKILSDNVTEFKNKLFEDVAKQLGVEYISYTPHYSPQCNSKIEGFLKYLKSCIAKHIVNNMEWDQFTDLATAAYNFVPNVTSKEAPIIQNLIWQYKSMQCHQNAFQSFKDIINSNSLCKRFL